MRPEVQPAAVPSVAAPAAVVPYAVVAVPAAVLAVVVHHREADTREAAAGSSSSPLNVEPRDDMRSGHIPGSVNIPFTALLTEDKTMKSRSDLQALFAEAGIDGSTPSVTTCGSGVTAAVLYLGLTIAGHRQLALYDGSWSEGGSRDDTPIET